MISSANQTAETPTTGTPLARVNKMTHEDALMEAELRETWLVDGLISSTSTLVYGEAKVGKSFLMSAMIAALQSGGEFLGRQVPDDREFSVAVCWTDDGGAADYASQIQTVIPDGTSVRAEYYALSVMRYEDWDNLHQDIVASGHNVVLIDNLTQALDGSINDDSAVTRFFHGVRLFTRSGIPVIIVGHSSEKANMNGGKSDKPMGSSVISQSVRWRCFVKRSRSGNLTLEFSGNYAEPHKIVAKHGAGARFEVLDTMDAERVKADAENSRQQRQTETLDLNRRIAEWVIGNCQGKGVNQAAKALSASSDFPGLTESAAKKKLQGTGPVAALLDRKGEGGTTVWSWAGGPPATP